MQGNCTQFFIFILKALASGTSCLDANAFVFSQKTPRTNLKYNINSPNFFITNFNDMKRMNFIRVALFAVFAFMGTISLSAQSWLPPAQAIVALNQQLDILSEPPVPNQPAGNVIATQDAFLEANAKSGCPNCELKSVKYHFAKWTLQRIKSGTDTGAAVEEVRAFMISNANNNVSVLGTIQAGYVWMDSIL
jgi:hypothetical protein